jgi:hypothetical protein
MFNLSETIRNAIEDLNTRDPETIANHIYPLIPNNEREELFKTMLRARIISNYGVERKTAHINIPRESSQVSEQQESLSNTGNIATKPKKGINRASRINSWFTDLLATSVHTELGYKSLGDCTFEDLTYIHASLVQKSDELLTSAIKYEKLQKLLTDCEVDSVKDLPENRVQEMLG